MSKTKNPRDNDGVTPLHSAALKGHLHISKEIVEHVEKKKSKDVVGWIPLHWAATACHLNTCVLIKPNAKDKSPTNTNQLTVKESWESRFISKIGHD